MGFLNPGAATHQWPKEVKAANTILWRLPKNIVSSDNIVVNADERAVFLRDGKVYGILGEGSHMLSSGNLPWLGGLFEAATGKKFVGEVYYIWMKEFTDQKFGTAEPMVFKDPDFGLVRIRAFGTFAFQVIDPQVFITKFVGTLHAASADKVVEWIKGQLVRGLNDLLGELKNKGLTVVDFPSQLDEISTMVLSKVKDDLKPYGVEITRLGNLNLNLPEEVQKAVDQRSSMGALGLNDPGMRQAYMTMQQGKMMGGAAEGMAKGGDGSGAAMAGMGAGMGMGVGMGMMSAQNMAQTNMQNQAAPAPKKQCSKCGAMNDINTKFCAECGTPFVQQQAMAVAANVKCAKCQGDVPTGNKFCPNCGNPMS
jgi:membrane protease subunit (stomatin/prohibitin family)